METPESAIPIPHSTNWSGICSTIGLLVWVLLWLKREAGTTLEAILCYGTLAAIHFAAIKAARRRYGWFYLAPIGLFWSLVVIALSGGITY